jgi:Ser/Thr protein kinase RdoA (MazF antagonist)
MWDKILNFIDHQITPTNISLYENWGKALAKLHVASLCYQPKNFQYDSWENDRIELEDYAKNEDKHIQTELIQVIDYLKNHPQADNNYGLIHGDHRKGNVLTAGNQVYFIDFDLPRFCWFMDDISRPFFSSIMQNQQNWQNKLIPYLKVYHSVFPLTQAELPTFPWFIRYKALNMYL